MSKVAHKPSYALEFFNYMVPVVTKPGCRHCHGTGVEGQRGGKLIVCRCIEKRIMAARSKSRYKGRA